MQILVELQETMGSDLSIANAAWTSTYDKSKREEKYLDTDKIESLVKRLIIDKHGTPVESVVFRFWIRMPIFVDRQHMTHRIASHNGLSGRYRTMPEDFYEIPNDVNEILNKCGSQYIAKDYSDICLNANSSYRNAINELKKCEKNGIITNEEFKRAREILRGQFGILIWDDELNDYTHYKYCTEDIDKINNFLEYWNDFVDEKINQFNELPLSFCVEKLK
ncbi:MAG: FAD-dependent thymidylate synthase [Betaproteobacteria bacterium]|nr:FAD-dependent thymidylate synthase [Betaproteobacteria bacterium]